MAFNDSPIWMEPPSPTGETIPAWLLIFDGIVLIPSCAATTSHPPATSGCKPIPGHAFDVIADSDGTLIYSEHQTGGPVPAT